MISAKEAYNISFVNDVCKEYLDEIERKILEEAKVGKVITMLLLNLQPVDLLFLRMKATKSL
jgi:hypothetical protein